MKIFVPRPVWNCSGRFESGVDLGLGSWSNQILHLQEEACLHRDRSLPFRVVKTFGQILESADEMSIEDQESLVAILQKRLRAQRRAELVKAVKEARQEFQAGRCRPASAKELFKTIFS